MSVNRAKPLLATESGLDITDRKDSVVNELATFAPQTERSLNDIYNKLDIISNQLEIICQNLFNTDSFGS